MQPAANPIPTLGVSHVMHRVGVVLLGVLSLTLMIACGGEEDTNSQPAQPSATAGPAAAISDNGLDRSSLVLCDALEPHREELAAIVGFQQRADRSLSVMRSECAVRGSGGAFARVKLQPAMAPSAEAVARQSYEGEASPAPELGEDAWFVDQPAQPHVIFSMGGLIFDVDAENESTLGRETMIKLAQRMRDIIREAN